MSSEGRFAAAAGTLVLLLLASDPGLCRAQVSADRPAVSPIAALAGEFEAEFSLKYPRADDRGGRSIEGHVRRDGSAKLVVARDGSNGVSVRLLPARASSREALLGQAIEGIRAFRLGSEVLSSWSGPQPGMLLKVSAGTATIEVGMRDAAHAAPIYPIAHGINDLLPAAERVSFPGNWTTRRELRAAEAGDRVPLRLAGQPLSARLPDKWSLSVWFGTSERTETHVYVASNGETNLDEAVPKETPARRLSSTEEQRSRFLKEAMQAAERYTLVPPSERGVERSEPARTCTLLIRSYGPTRGEVSPWSREVSPSSWIRIEERDAGRNEEFSKALLGLLTLARELPPG